MSAIAAAARPSAGGVKGVLRALTFGFLLLVGGLMFGSMAGDLAASGRTFDIAALGVVLLPLALWRRPHLGPVVLLSAAVLIEQVGASTTAGEVTKPGAVPLAPPVPITSHIPLFQGLGSIHLEPADLLLVLVAIVYMARTTPATRAWPSSHVSRSMAALIGTVVLGLMIGVTHHSQTRIALMEARPYVYLSATYVLTAGLIRSRQALQKVLWALVICAGVKAAQGLYIYMEVRSWRPRPDDVLGHEDAYTFAVFIFLVAALWIFQVPGRLRKTATWLLPLVIAANLANNRRAAWLMLGGGLLVMMIIGYQVLPSRRHMLNRVLLILVAISAVYFPAFWNKNDSLALPAVAVRSQFSPNARDESSDLYRIQENANLKLNIKQGGLIGKGFGVPIDYALPIVDISKGDPLIKYVPHNLVLYTLMRMGLLGAIAMWALLGTAIIAGCRLARSVNREVAVIGTVVACSIVAYALEGATDQGFFFYRIAFITGTLLGLAEAARRIQRRSSPPAVVPAAPTPAPARELSLQAGRAS